MSFRGVLNCPFCGDIATLDDGTPIGGWFGQCLNGDCNATTKESEDYDVALSIWNNRVAKNVKPLKFHQTCADEPDASAKSVFGHYYIGCNLEQDMQWYVTGPMGFNKKVNSHHDVEDAAHLHYVEMVGGLYEPNAKEINTKGETK